MSRKRVEKGRNEEKEKNYEKWVNGNSKLVVEAKMTYHVNSLSHLMQRSYYHFNCDAFSHLLDVEP